MNNLNKQCIEHMNFALSVSKNNAETLLSSYLPVATVCCKDSRGISQAHLPVGITAAKSTMPASARRLLVFVCV